MQTIMRRTVLYTSRPRVSNLTFQRNQDHEKAFLARSSRLSIASVSGRASAQSCARGDSRGIFVKTIAIRQVTFSVDIAYRPLLMTVTGFFSLKEEAILTFNVFF